MKEHILVLQKCNIQEDLKRTLREFLENDAFVNRTIHHFKACCCNKVKFEGDKSKKRKSVIHSEEERLARWLHKNTTSLCQSVEKCSCDIEQKENITDCDKWIENLHCYADYLPKFGCQKKLIWLLSEDAFLKPEDDLGLLGALKRLVEWHGVRISMLCPQLLLDNGNLQSWCDVLYAEILTEKDNLSLSSHRQLWSGSVALTGSQGSTLDLPGFSLCNYENSTRNNSIAIPPAVAIEKDTVRKEEMFTCFVVEDKLELIAPVALSEVPIYFLTDDFFSLSIPSRSKYIKKSRHFLQKLSLDSGLGYILRLYTGTSWKNLIAKEGNFDKSVKKEIMTSEDKEKDEEDNEWIKLISNNISNVFNVPNKEEIELTGDTGFYQFLVYESVSGNIVAQLMRNTDQIDPSLVEDLQKAEELRLQTSSQLGENDEDQNTEMLLSELPHWTGIDLGDIMDDLEKFQTSVLHQWICEREEKNESMSVTAEFLLQLLGLARDMFIKYRQASYLSERPRSDRCVSVQPKPTNLDDPYSQLERSALLIREAQEERALNGPCGLSPPKARVLTLDAKQFLKFFKKDGTASKELTGLSVQKSPKRRFGKYDSGELSHEEWPKCKFYRYHDIYYHSDASSELEELCERMKARLISMETDSTCTLKQTRSTLTVQKDVRKLRQRSREDGTLSNQMQAEKTEGSVHHKPKTPRAKKKADAMLMEKRKRMVQISKQAQSRNGGQPVAKPGPSPRKPCRTPKKSTSNLNTRRTPRKSPGKALTPKKTPRKSTPRKNTKSPSAKKSKEYTLEDKKARAKRHTQLLENILTRTLDRHGVPPSDKNFKTCYQKLCTITKCFLKDLKKGSSLRDEIESIAEDNVQNVLRRILKT